MKLLLTSSGVSNPSIRDALVALLGTSIDESTALVVPSGINPFRSGPTLAADLVRGRVSTPLTDLGWRSLGLLELAVLPTIDRDVWVAAVETADAVLVWGGDPLYLSTWLTRSGLAGVLPSLPGLVYVGVSAGSIAAGSTFGETYLDPPPAGAAPITSEHMEFDTPAGPVGRTFVTASGAGFVDVAVIPHLDHPDHPDASTANAQRWAAKLPVPTYAIDDQTALTVSDGVVGVVSEGVWRRFDPVGVPELR